MTETGQSTEPPTDPNAPTTATLPSGKAVSIRSPRTLLGADVAAAIGAQTEDGMQGVVEMRTALIALTVTETDPGRAGTAVLTAVPGPDGTQEAADAFKTAIAAVRAQRADDFRRLYSLVTPAWMVAVGASNIVDYQEFADPKASTSPSSGPSPSSEDEPPR